jgi:hypothetical protein
MLALAAILLLLSAVPSLLRGAGWRQRIGLDV